MQTPARIARHPIHPMLVVFPLGLFVAALVFDIAAVPGLIDYFSLQGAAQRTGTYHMVANLIMMGLFAVNFALRTQWGTRFVASDSIGPLVLTLLGVILLGFSGWLGGHMVYIHRVGVEAPLSPRANESPRRRVA